MSKGKRNRQNRPKEPGITNAQYRMIRREVDKQILAADREYSVNFAAGVLWALHVAFGFGAGRLRKMWDAYRKIHDELREYYEGVRTWKSGLIAKKGSRKLGDG